MREREREGERERERHTHTHTHDDNLKQMLYLCTGETLMKKLDLWCKEVLSLTVSETTNFRRFQTERACRRQYQI